MRRLVWFSCGAASAVAAKKTLEQYPNAEVLYCDTLKYEHEDNIRFMTQVSQWIKKPIKILRSEKYTDIYDVFKKTGWLVGIGGARCTTELKKNVRRKYEEPDDIHIFGFTSDEKKRIDRFHSENPDLQAWFPLYELGISKPECFEILKNNGIELPMMYKLGYLNNNCIGCVKGGAGYWNKIRKDFPHIFNKMAKVERELNAAINKKIVKGKRLRVFLDELELDAGNMLKEPEIECGVLCIHERKENETTNDI